LARVVPVTVTWDPRQDGLELTWDPRQDGLEHTWVTPWEAASEAVSAGTEGGRGALVRAALGRLY
jgi:hypothetical protein